MKLKLAQTELGLSLATLGIGLMFMEKIRRKYVKVIITADVRTKKLIAVDVKIGEVSESKVAAKHIKLLKENGIKLKKFYGDGAYDIMKYSM